MDRAASLTLAVAWLTSSAERAISPTLPLIMFTLRDAVCMLDDISAVTADCSSTAAEIVTEISFTFATTSVIAPMAPTTSRADSCVCEICLPMSSVAFAVWVASSFTSEATVAVHEFCAEEADPDEDWQDWTLTAVDETGAVLVSIRLGAFDVPRLAA